MRRLEPHHGKARERAWTNQVAVNSVVMGGLAIGRVGYDRWLKFMAPLLLILVILITAVLSIGALQA